MCVDYGWCGYAVRRRVRPAVAIDPVPFWFRSRAQRVRSAPIDRRAAPAAGTRVRPHAATAGADGALSY